MPELPEVETTRRGILPHLRGRRVTGVIVRDGRLRWPVPPELDVLLVDRTVLDIRRRGKYLLFDLDGATLLVHLGMSGSLRVLHSPPAAARKHDHVDVLLDDGSLLRYHDPRRFGAVLWLDADPAQHPLLCNLGPEPLEEHFSGAYLYRCSRGRRSSVKQFLMDGHIVVGVGNIYASEALFLAGINPRRQAGRVAASRYDELAHAVREVLERAIAQGGTTLRDYVNGDGASGYFQQSLAVYGRDGEPCMRCGSPIRGSRTGQRSTFHCPNCQR
jgi:formamidopyrimidine-DNA glycosylase